MYIVLFIAMAFNLVMGMVGLQRAAYLFLSVTMAPAVAQMAVVPLILIHLFIIFYAGYGGLTPPVALHAFIAASMAGADPMKTAYASLKLGSVLAFIPFFFVLQPALAMQGTPFDIVYHLLLAMIGIFFVASSLEGFLAGLGKLPMWERVVGGLGGFLIAFPEVSTTLVGGGMAVLVVIVHLVHKRLIAKVPAT